MAFRLCATIWLPHAPLPLIPSACPVCACVCTCSICSADHQLPHDPTGKNGVMVKPSDVVTILDPKEELPVTQPKQQGFVQNVETAAAPAVAAETQQ